MFFDRYDAGKQLACKLLKYKDTDAVVYALPRGGVLTGMEVAKVLQVPLELVIACKIGHPMNRECAVCAVTEDGERICDEIGVCCVDKSWIESESSTQQAEAKRRRIMYKGNSPAISAEGKIAILVDDGIATGLTMKVAIQSIQKQKPAKIIIAAPVASHDVIVDLGWLVDEVAVIKDEDSFRQAVGAYYKHFSEVSDTEVKAALGFVSSVTNAGALQRKTKNVYERTIKKKNTYPY